MGQYFRVNGDYNIKCSDGGTIVLDTGPAGNTLITGNLTVSGGLTSISTQNVEIRDKIITLNDGDTGPGVTVDPIFGNYSGIEINRGSYTDSTTVPKAAFVWSETNPPGFDTGLPDTEEDPASGSGYWMIATGSEGAYSFRDSNLKLRRILTDSTEDDGDLTLIGSGTGVVKVAGTTNYRLQVTDADDIPNKDYVDYSIQNNPTFQIVKDDSRVLIADKDVSPNLSTNGGSLSYYTNVTSIPVTESVVGMLVDGQQSAVFYYNRARIQDLLITDNQITTDPTSLSGTTVFVNTSGTGKLRTNYAIQLDNNAGTPANVSGSHIIYSKSSAGQGGTGLYYVTTSDRDELVSKNRALLFSMLF